MQAQLVLAGAAVLVERCPSVSCKQLKDVCACSPVRRDTGGCVFGERTGVRGSEWEWMCGLRWGSGGGRRFPQEASSPSTESRHSLKDPAGPDACLCQQEEALRGLSQSHPAPHPPMTQEVCCVTPIPTPRAQCGKWAQGQSMRQTDTPVGERKSAGVGGVVGGGPSRHLLTEPTNPREESSKGRLKPASTPRHPQRPVMNQMAFRRLPS